MKRFALNATCNPLNTNYMVQLVSINLKIEKINALIFPGQNFFRVTGWVVNTWICHKPIDISP